MAPNEHPVIARTRTSVWQKLGYLVVVLSVGAGFAGLGLALSAKDESGETAKKIRNFRPCVDANGARQGVKLSAGCRVLFANLARLCARNPGFCRRSQQLAVKEAQNRSAEREIGPTASLRGGGGTKGNKPQSPSGPSPGGGGLPDANPPVVPDDPPGPPTGPQTPVPHTPPKPERPDVTSPPPVVDAPGLIPQPLKPILCGVAGVCLDP